MARFGLRKRFGLRGLGFRVQGFRVFRVFRGLGFRVLCSGVQGFRVFRGLGFRGLGLRDLGFRVNYRGLNN